MKIIFAGTPEIVLETLSKIHASSNEITLILTNEDKPFGRGKKIKKPPVKIFAEDNNIDLKQPKNLKDEGLLDFLKSKEADLLLVFAYGHLVPEEILNVFKMGALNIHTSLLPKLRGAAPIQRAILNGDKETGVTFMKMEKGLDTGPIYEQEIIKISDQETSESLTEKMSKVSSRKILQIIDNIEKNNFMLTPQNHKIATYAPKIIKEESKINWNKKAIDIVNQINGLSPSPGSYSSLNKNRLNFFLAEFTDIRTKGPGLLVEASREKLLIGAKDFCVRIKELSRPGKKRQKYESFYNGSKHFFSEEKFLT